MQFSDLTCDAIASVFEVVGLGLAIVGPDGRVQWANGHSSSLLGWQQGDGLDSVLRCHPERLHKAVLMRIRHAKAREWHRVIELNGRFVENLYFPIELGEGRGILIVTQDVTERERAEKELQRVASTDALTGLYNRQHLNTLSEDQSSVQQVAGVIMVDINGLKQVNDKLGHQAGDELIIRAAKALRSSVRERDLLFRVGGDEFVVLVCSHEHKAVFEVEQRIKALSCCSDYTHPEYMCISVGAALYDAGSTLERCINLADQRMYIEKRMYYDAKQQEV